MIPRSPRSLTVKIRMVKIRTLLRNTRTNLFWKMLLRSRSTKWPKRRVMSLRRKFLRASSSLPTPPVTPPSIVSFWKRCWIITVSCSGSRINSRFSSKRRSNAVCPFLRFCLQRRKNFMRKQKRWPTNTVGLFLPTKASVLETTATRILTCSSSPKSFQTRRPIDTSTRQWWCSQRKCSKPPSTRKTCLSLRRRSIDFSGLTPSTSLNGSSSTKSGRMSSLAWTRLVPRREMISCSSGWRCALRCPSRATDSLICGPRTRSGHCSAASLLMGLSTADPPLSRWSSQARRTKSRSSRTSPPKKTLEQVVLPAILAQPATPCSLKGPNWRKSSSKRRKEETRAWNSEE